MLTPLERAEAYRRLSFCPCGSEAVITERPGRAWKYMICCGGEGCRLLRMFLAPTLEKATLRWNAAVRELTGGKPVEREIPAQNRCLVCGLLEPHECLSSRSF